MLTVHWRKGRKMQPSHLLHQHRIATTHALRKVAWKPRHPIVITLGFALLLLENKGYLDLGLSSSEPISYHVHTWLKWGRLYGFDPIAKCNHATRGLIVFSRIGKYEPTFLVEGERVAPGCSHYLLAIVGSSHNARKILPPRLSKHEYNQFKLMKWRPHCEMESCG